MSVKLHTEDSWKFGQINYIPGLGKTKISEEGFIEVPNREIADKIVSANIGFDYEGLKKKAEENELNQNEDNAELIGSLEGKSFDELKVFAQPFPKKDWKNLNEDQLKEYLISKLS